MGMLLAPVGIVGCDARAPASVNSGHMEDAMQNGTSTTTAQLGAETDQLAGREYDKVKWLVRKAIACLHLDHDPDMVLADLEEAQQYLERCVETDYF